MKWPTISQVLHWKYWRAIISILIVAAFFLGCFKVYQLLSDQSNPGTIGAPIIVHDVQEMPNVQVIEAPIPAKGSSTVHQVVTNPRPDVVVNKPQQDITFYQQGPKGELVEIPASTPVEKTEEKTITLPDGTKTTTIDTTVSTEVVFKPIREESNLSGALFIDQDGIQPGLSLKLKEFDLKVPVVDKSLTLSLDADATFNKDIGPGVSLHLNQYQLGASYMYNLDTGTWDAKAKVGLELKF